MKRVVFIGAGSIATNLCRIFNEKGYKITQVISRSASSASALARSVFSGFSTKLEEMDLNADYYFICVNDDSLKEIAQKIPAVNGILAHTSGSTSMEIFKDSAKNFGVFYPLQSFSKFMKADLSETPIFIEANNQESEQKLKDLAEEITRNCHILNSDDRMALHICGIFANNFTNHMYAIAHNLAKKHNIPFEYFFPLIKETADKISHRAPLASQTGPAVRKDMDILEKHKSFLESYPELLELYKMISDSIIKFSQ